LGHDKNNPTIKEYTMNRQDIYECGICYYKGITKGFTPITVSANFKALNALECPKCLNNDMDSFAKVDTVFKQTVQTPARRAA
jgi:hypothetical protein